MDAPETNRKFAESLELDYPILSDPDQAVARTYGILMPVIGLAKRVTFYIGADGRILAIDRDVKAATSGADMATRLETLNVPRRVRSS